MLLAPLAVQESTCHPQLPKILLRFPHLRAGKFGLFRTTKRPRQGGAAVLTGNSDLFRCASVGRAVARIARALFALLVLRALFLFGLGGGRAGSAGIGRSGSGSTRGS